MKNEKLPWDEIDSIIARALKEDIGSGDLTTEYFIPSDVVLEAEWVAKEPCRVAGLPIVDRILEKLNPQIKSFWAVNDGDCVEGGKFGLVKGPAQDILRAERTALNFLQRLSGIATLTAAFVEKVKPYGVKIYDTRKTTPMLRVLEKYAVRLGGGFNHRMGLNEMVLIKDNHRCVLDSLGIQDWKTSIQHLKKDHPHTQIGIEVTRSEDVSSAVLLGANFILLDNMDSEKVRKVVEEWKDKIILEASGGIGLDQVELYAKTGVDRISIGALTHSVRAINMSLEVLGVV
ncbi:MAG: carboxylating nicotinate-nucleotide diphosphorylase [Chlamydiae bacterium]|nr:carboxylating nicotinate-nucleotide diphosphorylase [Chlamydiota bacterium]MBI3277501.1 carboxylating nicotinate-nucleotide diphosphorylase [Chlamydiota bacterium]